MFKEVPECSVDPDVLAERFLELLHQHELINNPTYLAAVKKLREEKENVVKK